MTIKSRISLLISLNFTILFGIICIMVIGIFSEFRKQEFEERLSEKAITSIRLLVEVKEIDHDLLRTIDKHTIHKLYNEKILIFNDNFEIIYSSLDDTRINWNPDDLVYLKYNNSFFREDGENEIYGIYYNSGGKNYYAIVSANDNYGKRKQSFLVYLLGGAYLLFTLATWLLTFTLIKKELRPLDDFHKKITTINELNLDSPLAVRPNSKNEIELLSKEFNQLLMRIKQAYEKQKDFTSQASHELRTPLARISAQIQNHLLQVNEDEKIFLNKLLTDVNQLNQLINSLLILAKLDNGRAPANELCRIDEALFQSIEKINEQYQGFKVNLQINLDEDKLNLLEIKANASLIEIAFFNLLKNAYLYSTDRVCDIDINYVDDKISIRFSNKGNVLSADEQQFLFEAFHRGENSKGSGGLGLGLRIVKRVLESFSADVFYTTENGLNNFFVLFSKKLTHTN